MSNEKKEKRLIRLARDISGTNGYGAIIVFKDLVAISHGASNKSELQSFINTIMAAMPDSLRGDKNE